jgi:hypothetical protein
LLDACYIEAWAEPSDEVQQGCVRLLPTGLSDWGCKQTTACCYMTVQLEVDLAFRGPWFDFLSKESRLNRDVKLIGDKFSEFFLWLHRGPAVFRIKSWFWLAFFADIS